MSVLESLTGRVAATPTVDADAQTLADILANKRRQIIIEELAAESPLRKATLAERVAARETDGEVRPDDRKNVYVSIHQTHFGRMHAAGVIDDRDGERTVIVRGPQFEGYAAALAALREHARGAER